MPAMSDAPLRGYNGRHEWFWEPGDEEHIFPLEKLMHIYYNSVGHNSTLIMGLTPDPQGLLPQADVKRLEEWGKPSKKLFLLLLVALMQRVTKRCSHSTNPKQSKISSSKKILLRGQRVRAYSIHAFSKGEWKKIAMGESIGHKRIHQLNPIDRGIKTCN